MRADSLDSTAAPARTRALALLFACVTLALGGCASTKAATDGAQPAEGSAAEPVARKRNPDPWEPFNRGVFRFNDAIDRHALRPVASAYAEYTPRWMQTGVTNFFTNLFYPTTILHQFLQGKFKQGSQDVGRFVINTTLGWGGVLDVASGAHLPIHDEDSGQTLGWWGVPSGPYLVLPLIGPSTVRDTPARIADDFTQPFRWYNADAERWLSLTLNIVSKRASVLPYDRLVQESYDPYVFIRDAWLQRREYAVRDGNVRRGATPSQDDANWAEEALREDESGWAEEALREDEAAAVEPAVPGAADTTAPEAAQSSPGDNETAGDGTEPR
jgi:phospholipid-binding lipoprotein MlaA